MYNFKYLCSEFLLFWTLKGQNDTHKYALQTLYSISRQSKYVNTLLKLKKISRELLLPQKCVGKHKNQKWKVQVTCKCHAVL